MSALHIGPRRRANINPETVASIAASIQEIGLQNPISVVYKDDIEDEDGDLCNCVPVVVAGVHRVKALLSLGQEYERTEVVVFEDERSANLWEISENLHRADLTIDERADHRKAWLMLMGVVDEEGEVQPAQTDEGEHAGGGEGGVLGQLGPKLSRRGREDEGRPESGIRLAIRTMPKLDGKTDEAKRHQIRRDLLIASRTPEAKEVCREVGLDDNQSALIEVARAPKDQQAEKAREIAERKAAAREAARLARQVKPPAQDDDDAIVARFLREFDDLPPRLRERVLFELSAAA